MFLLGNEDTDMKAQCKETCRLKLKMMNTYNPSPSHIANENTNELIRTKHFQKQTMNLQRLICSAALS